MDSEAIVLLRRIAVAVEKLVSMVPTEKASAARPGATPLPQRVADDADLDSQYGDEKIRFNPRDWTGDSFVGRTMSECPAPFLDALAKVYDYFAQKNEAAKEMTDKGQPKWVFDQRTASRARGWAVRIRDGHVPTRHVPEPFGDDVPF